jgi:hypothetical protein
MDRDTEQPTGPFPPDDVVLPVQRGAGPLDLVGRRGAAPVAPPRVRDEARSAVLHRHARLTRSGRPVFCTPSRDELAGVVALRQGRGTDGKAVYPTREAAEAAARELEELGARQLRSYRCGRSRSGHFHLTTDTSLAARIPAQRRPLSA